MNRFQRLFLWASTAAATSSGLTYFWMKYLVESTEPWAVVNHPLEPWMLKAHILTAPLMLFAVGLIATDHIWRHWKSRLPTGRRTGLVTAAVFGPLVLTGYLVQTVTLPWLLAVVTWSHTGFGFLCAAGLVLHRRALRRKRAVRPGRLPVVTANPVQGAEAAYLPPPAPHRLGRHRAASTGRP